jgi:asparagine synthetase A
LKREVTKKADQQPALKGKEKEKEKEKEEKAVEILSKGGTLDVGIHTGITTPNTTVPVVVSCL